MIPMKSKSWLKTVSYTHLQSREQVEFLLSIGCQYAQGYYYYEPMNKRDFEKLLLDKKQLKILEKDHDLSIVHLSLIHI